MKRIILTKETLIQVAGLIENGKNWTEIEEIIGKDKRIVQREYQRWVREQPEKDLQALRTQAIDKALQEHFDALIALAESFVLHLEVPQSPDESRKAADFIRNNWESDVFMELGSDQLSEDKGRRKSQFLLRQKALIFKALKEHTREKVRWGILEDWEKSWDACTQRLFPKMHQEIKNVATGFLNNQTVLQTKIQRLAKQPEVMKRTTDWMEKIIRDAIWQSINKDKPMQISRESASVMAPSELDIDTLFEDVVGLCSKAANTLCSGHSAEIFTELRSEISRMGRSTEELYDMLNPLVLRPIILRTRCELCPA